VNLQGMELSRKSRSGIRKEQYLQGKEFARNGIRKERGWTLQGMAFCIRRNANGAMAQRKWRNTNGATQTAQRVQQRNGRNICGKRCSMPKIVACFLRHSVDTSEC